MEDIKICEKNQLHNIKNFWGGLNNLNNNYEKMPTQSHEFTGAKIK